MQVRTPLGVVRFSIQTEQQSALETEFSLLHPEIPAFISGRVDDLWTGLWRVQVLQDTSLVKFACMWEEGYSWTSGGPNSGEHLDAQSFDNEDWMVTVGTEDDEVLQRRAKQGDGLPEHVQISFAEYAPQGLIVPLGGLRAGDVCRIHFSIAWAKFSEDLGPWLAVDRGVSEDELEPLGS